MSEVWGLRRFVRFYTTFISHLYPRISGRFSAAVGRRRFAPGPPTLDEQFDDKLGTAHSAPRMGFQEVWHEPTARHSGRPRAPDTSWRAERPHRCRAYLGRKIESPRSNRLRSRSHLRRPGTHGVHRTTEGRAHAPSARQRISRGYVHTALASSNPGRCQPLWGILDDELSIAGRGGVPFRLWDRTRPASRAQRVDPISVLRAE
jgi:hypothetical protein